MLRAKPSLPALAREVMRTKLLVVNYDRGPDARPVVKPGRRRCRKIDTTVAHGNSEVVVPVSAVNGEVVGKVHHVRHIRQIVVVAPHGLEVQLVLDRELTYGGVVTINAGADRRAKNRALALVGREPLLTEVDVDPTRPEGIRSGRVAEASDSPGATSDWPTTISFGL
jgi:hypothetical protein